MMKEANHETIGQAVGASEPDTMHDALVLEHPLQTSATGTDATAPSASHGAALGGRRLRRRRLGVCHRCGWTGLVSRVGREDRRRIGMGRALGRLCDDCFVDLLAAPSAEGGATTAPDKAEADAATAPNGGIPRPLAGAGFGGRPPSMITDDRGVA
jgi:hypothetical protein